MANMPGASVAEKSNIDIEKSLEVETFKALAFLFLS